MAGKRRGRILVDCAGDCGHLGIAGPKIAIATMKLIFKTPPLFLTLFLCAFSRAQDADPLEARQIAKDAYIYSFPVMENYRVQYARFAGDRKSVV